MLYSDSIRLMKSLENDFPDVIKLSSIGKSFEGRNINLITLDARPIIVENEFQHMSSYLMRFKEFTPKSFAQT